MCRDGVAILWDIKDGRQVKTFTWNPSKKTAYRFRACWYNNYCMFACVVMYLKN